VKQILVFSHARKAFDGNVVLDEVTLAFLPGAKIGVVGPNGTGKSTLLRMMAGLEQPSNGEARLMPGYTVGILQQEPPLDESKTVLGNVEDGVAETKALLARYNEIAEQMAAGYSGGVLEEMGRLQEQLDHREAWDTGSRLEQAMDALRCPPPDAEVGVLSGGSGAGSPCASCFGPSRTCCCWTSRPTIWTPRASRGWSSTWRSIPARWWRSPTTATSSTTSRAGFWNSTAAAPTRMRATTPPIWRPRRPG